MVLPNDNVQTVHGSPYIFSVKPKWRPQGHSTVVVSKHCEGFVAIWLCAREDIAHNRFQLLFIYIDYIYNNLYIK